ncbi:hypothetical protein M409DRAFT_66856 [Zasmidium cellare ATCC 36951]|uniref:Uncharacterized protein n=1 Tax=Zasmidium cellare ATCC 36951 TaxID=1080233 RepID=A0A6A6CIU6_ZASCE|nr:uncharacterized protein M409DRAFT_66856 [Zasmidium cellare ATCC 36951]KAF2165882.1 hypothetical protein M409DRAFT_66856 [Zasmidium cellare ATCC 36951]
MLWRLERGERLGLLDLLAGSTTVVNTILTQISLRILNAAGLILIVAWAISPLGGQASLRVMTVSQQNATSSAEIKYMSTNHSFGPYVSGDLGSLATLMDGLFNAALLGPERIKNSPTDQWNNVKVPHLESIANDPSLLANNSWIPVPDQNVTYASLIGLPIADLPASCNASFTIESFYWTLDCSALTDSYQPPGYKSNDELPDGWSNRTNGLGNILLLDYAPRAANKTNCRGSPYDPAYVPRVLAYNSWDPSSAQFGALCTIWTSYVELETQCTSITNCSVTAIRNSTQVHPTPAWTMLDGPEDACNWYIWFLAQFVDTVNVKRSGTSTPVQGYLLDPNSPASPLLDKPMTSVPKKTFAVRLAQLLNTYWSITAGPYAVPYGFAGDIDNTNVDYYDETAANATTTTAQLTQTFNVIRCHSAWLGVLLGSSIFLIAASILSIVLRLRSKTPDLSLNWSTSTRDNPYVDTNYSGSSLDHTKRSQLMKSNKVRFGDVEPGRRVGHLAVGSLESHAVAKADRSRMFD